MSGSCGLVFSLSRSTIWRLCQAAIRTIFEIDIGSPAAIDLASLFVLSVNPGPALRKLSNPRCAFFFINSGGFLSTSLFSILLFFDFISASAIFKAVICSIADL